MTEQDLRSIFSHNLKKFRTNRKFSQASFAEKIDISIPFLSDIENGKKWVSPVTLVKIAEALNIEVFELLKPETTLPENAILLLEKYTTDIYKAFGDIADNICQDYIEQLKNKT